ncbi:conserved hypothetical protein [Candidatus Desulfosporosinus infrequens]|uniref:Helix-turn-helix domain-containing protein n=1 Tax=Candidatus Desulfosporosinus infrequens TaxID=2043169 RepID=A0A2U3L0W0_9FIRM|nr:conserved hypothetical protein [Candidatus Desulfosporosinus infrequens]
MKIEFRDVISIPEASAQWGISVDIIKRYARDSKLLPSEARRASKYWLITRQGMERVFGKLDSGRDAMN